MTMTNDMDDAQDLETLTQKCAEYLEGWKRAQADYANLKRDTERDRLEFAKYANERLLQEILPAIDQYETALSFTPNISHLPEEDQKKLKNWIIGLQAVRSLWERSFEGIGLQKVSVNGAFDPQYHEAVGRETDTAIPAGQIIRVMQDGWILNGKLLRPAKVIISETHHQPQ